MTDIRLKIVGHWATTVMMRNVRKLFLGSKYSESYSTVNYDVLIVVCDENIVHENLAVQNQLTLTLLALFTFSIETDKSNLW